MIQLIKISMSLLMVVFTISCGEAQQISGKGEAKNISVEEFTTMASKSGEVTILDVRTDREWAEGYIDGAIQINFYDKEFREKIKALPKDKPVLVYCAVGGRSGNAMKLLQSAGISQVYNLAGGIDAWRKSGKPVTKG